jgi:hypothetical protein
MIINKIWSSTRTSISGVLGESLARVFTSTDERSTDGCGRTFPNVHVHFKCTYTSPCYEGVQFEIERRGENAAKPFLPYVPKCVYPLRTVNVPVEDVRLVTGGSRTTSVIKSVTSADAVPAAMRRANMRKL